MMRALSVFAATSLCLVNTTAAFANVLPFPCGWYLEGNYGESHASGVHFQGQEGSGNGTGWSIHGGYKFMPNFAAEIGYTDYAQTKIKNDADITFARAKHYSAEGALKGMWPFSDTGFDVFAKAGLAYINSSVNVEGPGSNSTSTSEGLYVGGGVEYALAHELLINTQWERAYGNNNTGRLDLLSVGLALLFN